MKTLEEILNKFARDLFTKTTELDLIQMIRPVTDTDRRKFRDGMIAEAKEAILALVPGYKEIKLLGYIVGVSTLTPTVSQIEQAEGWNAAIDATLKALNGEADGV